MKLTEDTILKTFEKKKYKVSDVNIIGVRSSLDIPNVFNDFIILYIPHLSVFNIFEATTDPGLYYQKNLMNKKGTAIFKSGQYTNCYKLGYHGSSQLTKHEALVQINNVTVYRDDNLDDKKDFLKEDIGLFGVNIHTTGSTFCGIPIKVDNWSAGCQVVRDNKKFQSDFIQILKKNFDKQKKYTYTLLIEKELVG